MKVLPDLYKRRRWTVNGYYAYPLKETDNNVQGFEQWLEFDALLTEARNGNFSSIPRLTERIANTDDWVLRGQYNNLLGDAGSFNTLTKILQNIPVDQNIVAEFGYGQILEYWGHLSVIPALIDMYERYSFSEDSMYVAASLSRLMEKSPGDIDAFPLDEGEDEIRAYTQMVRQRYRELCDRLGTIDVIVFRGEVIEIRYLCQRILDDLAHKHQFHEEMRHKFEAFTGVDCSSFYVDGELQPLAAAAIVEEFLESGACDQYEPGVRYFFGHRIPD